MNSGQNRLPGHPSPDSRPVLDAAARQRQQELKAVEQRIMHYIKSRLSTPLEGQGGGSFYQRWRVELWAAPILLLLTFNTFEPQFAALWQRIVPGPTAGTGTTSVVPVDPEAPEGTQPIPPESSPGLGAAATAPIPPPVRPPLDIQQIRAQPQTAWKAYVDNNPELVARLVVELAEAKDIPANKVRQVERDLFNRLATKLQNEQIQEEDYVKLRKGLFEYVLKRWDYLEDKKFKAGGSINLDLEGEFPPHLITGYLQSLGRTEGFGDVPDAPIPGEDLQAAIVLIALDEMAQQESDADLAP